MHKRVLIVFWVPLAAGGIFLLLPLQLHILYGLLDVSSSFLRVHDDVGVSCHCPQLVLGDFHLLKMVELLVLVMTVVTHYLV